MTPTTPDAVRIAQGARSEARIETIDGQRCVTKRYNDYRDPPNVKLARELAFYRAYAGVPILPKLVAHREPDTITVTHVAGRRLIDVIESGAGDDEVRAVSSNYGTVLGQFFKPSEPPDETAARSHIAATVDRINAALARHPGWQSAPIRHALGDLGALADAASPMMCKTDWSASNMLVRGDTVTCLYDFDTAYPGNGLTFLGDVLCSASLRLDWPAVRTAYLSFLDRGSAVQSDRVSGRRTLAGSGWGGAPLDSWILAHARRDVVLPSVGWGRTTLRKWAMKRHEVILGDLKLDKAWWAHTKLAILFGTITVVILSIYAFVL